MGVEYIKAKRDGTTTEFTKAQWDAMPFDKKNGRKLTTKYGWDKSDAEQASELPELKELAKKKEPKTT